MRSWSRWSFVALVLVACGDNSQRIDAAPDREMQEPALDASFDALVFEEAVDTLDVRSEALEIDAALEATVADVPVEQALDVVLEDVVVDSVVEETRSDAQTPEVSVDARTETLWNAGALQLANLPPRAELRALPGGGEGGPVVTSNNPEQFDGNGLLYGTARASASRGGETYPLSGAFGVYFHHVNHSSAVRYVSVFVTNPGSASVNVEARGSGYSQTETGGLGLGTSPDYRVSEEWLLDRPATVVPSTAVASQRPLLLWRTSVNPNAEIDGRFGVRTSGPVYAYVVVTSTADLNEAINVSRTDAPGIIAVSGTPPPPFGREAGVYAHDTWRGTINERVPAGPRRTGFMVNTATGSGLSPVQAFPALTNYRDSARESVGMYGNIYDMTFVLTHDGLDTNTRRVRLVFSSYVSGSISRYWDGVGTVDGRSVVLRHTPAARSTVLSEFTLASGAMRTVRFRAMVPGLTSIPQALFIESY